MSSTCPLVALGRIGLKERRRLCESGVGEHERKHGQDNGGPRGAAATRGDQCGHRGTRCKELKERHNAPHITPERARAPRSSGAIGTIHLTSTCDCYVPMSSRLHCRHGLAFAAAAKWGFRLTFAPANRELRATPVIDPGAPPTSNRSFSMQVEWTQLLLPILLSTVAVFIASSIIHMVLQMHNPDYRKLPNEDDVRDAIRRSSPAPGQYMIPHLHPLQRRPDPEDVKKFTDGPVGFLYVRASEMPKLGPFLGKWILYSAVVAALAADMWRGSAGHKGDSLPIRVSGWSA